MKLGLAILLFAVQIQASSVIARFVVMSDYHIGNSNGWFDTANGEPDDNMRFIQTLNPDFILDLGDDADTGQVSQYNTLLGIFGTYVTCPSFHTPGNHDGHSDATPDFTEWDATMPLNTAFEQASQSKKHFAFSTGSVGFVGWFSEGNTSPPPDGILPDGEESWIDDRLTRYNSEGKKVIMMSHRLPSFSAATQSLLASCVPYFLMGHYHVTNVVSNPAGYGGATVIDVPSLAYCGSLHVGGFNLVTITSTNMHMDLYEADPANSYPILFSQDFPISIGVWPTASSTTARVGTFVKKP